MTGFFDIDIQGNGFSFRGDFSSKRRHHNRDINISIYDSSYNYRNEYPELFNHRHHGHKNHHHDHCKHRYHHNFHHQSPISRLGQYPLRNYDNSDLESLLNNNLYHDLYGFDNPGFNNSRNYDNNNGLNNDSDTNDSVVEEQNNTEAENNSDIDNNRNYNDFRYNSKETLDSLDDFTLMYDNSDLENLFRKELYSGFEDPLMALPPIRRNSAPKTPRNTKPLKNDQPIDMSKYPKYEVINCNGKNIKIQIKQSHIARESDFDIAAFGAPTSVKSYYEALGNLEKNHTHNYRSDNGRGYIGKYQFGKAALVDIGFMEISGYRTNSKGKTVPVYRWKENKFNIKSSEDFKNSPEAQEYAVRKFTAQNWKVLKDLGADKYIGKTIKGIKITQAGLLAARHLGGPANLMLFLETGGEYVFHDGRDTPITKYLHVLSKSNDFR